MLLLIFWLINYREVKNMKKMTSAEMRNVNGGSLFLVGVATWLATKYVICGHLKPFKC